VPSPIASFQLTFVHCRYFTAKATQCMQPCDQGCLREQSQVDIHCLECHRQSRVSNWLLLYFAIFILSYNLIFFNGFFAKICKKNKQHKAATPLTRPFSTPHPLCSFTILSLNITSWILLYGRCRAPYLCTDCGKK
jgi:hypothetical protein